MSNRLYRNRKDRVIGGVCGGLGVYFGIDPVIVRLLFVVMAIWGGLGFLGYLVLWIIIPAEERLEAPDNIGEDVINSNVSEIEQRAQDVAQDARETFSGRAHAPNERTMWAAIALIVLGAVLLFGNVFGIAFARLWPVLLIVLGVYLIYQATQRR